MYLSTLPDHIEGGELAEQAAECTGAEKSVSDLSREVRVKRHKSVKSFV